jgi:outer membrane biosynthesis protein TonB
VSGVSVASPTQESPENETEGTPTPTATPDPTPEPTPTATPTPTDEPEPDVEPTDEPDETGIVVGSTPEPTPEPEQIEEQLGDLIIHSYDFDTNDAGDGGVFTIKATWTGRAPEQTTLTEMIELDSAGSTQISFQQQRLRPGEKTTIKMDAAIRSGGTAAIMVTTSESVENGEAIVLQDGDPKERPAIKMRNVVFGMGLTSALTAVGAFVFVLRRKHQEEYGKERIA